MRNNRKQLRFISNGFGLYCSLRPPKLIKYEEVEFCRCSRLSKAKTSPTRKLTCSEPFASVSRSDTSSEDRVRLSIHDLLDLVQLDGIVATVYRPCGATPMTVNGWRLIRSLRPTTSGAPPSLLFQYWCETTAT
jgi:hypothetical protein